MAEQIEGRLYQFTELTGKMSMPMHQYLLASDPAIMFATGNYSQAEWILPEISHILGDRPLKYLFLSHFESDECGGLELFLKKYPKLVTVCSSFTANELPGFGYRGKVVVCDELHGFSDGEISMRFFRYPAEVHLRDGLLAFEENSGVFYSSDVIYRDGVTLGKSVDSQWQKEVEGIDSARIPDDIRRDRLKSGLMNVSPKVIATGHGPVIRCLPDA